jgi:hypothetical protein
MEQQIAVVYGRVSRVKDLGNSSWWGAAKKKERIGLIDVKASQAKSVAMNEGGRQAGTSEQRSASLQNCKAECGCVLYIIVAVTAAAAAGTRARMQNVE